MTIRRAILAIFATPLFLGITTSSPAKPRSAPRPNLLFADQYHGDEVPLEVGKGWFALSCGEQTCNLAATNVRGARVRDEVVDEESGSETGVSISSDVEKPVMLIRISGLKAGNVPMSFIGSQVLGLSTYLKSLKLGSREYILLPEVPRRTESEDFPPGYTLTLHQGDRHQVIFALPEGGNDPHAELIWAGDLDGDGKLDFLINASEHYNVSHWTLWLSSNAGPGELVGKAAELVTTGC